MADRYSPAQTPLAIIGMGCRLPGADNLDQYWKMLVEGRHAIVELPPDRLDQQRYFDPEVGVRNKSYSKLGAIISTRDFDHKALPIADELVRSVDNAHLLMCDAAAAALRDAGFDPFNIPLRNTGVYVGHAQGSTLGGDYTYASCIAEAAQFLRDVPEFGTLPAGDQQQLINELIDRVRSKLPRRTAATPDVSASLVAGTISKAFGLTGPFLAINSACASSLQAMLLGARALQLGRVDMAIVGGASDCKGDSLVLFSNARAMSSTGSRPFDTNADGLITGEGYVALVMKTLDRALADGDKIDAVVRGLGVSSDGKGKSLWAPRKEGQIKAMERAYRDGLEFSDLQYLEAHATATQLGDATELNTLTEILHKHFEPGKKIPITSAKANIGHSLETAGIAGVIKTVLAMKNETVPPAVSVRELNTKIDWPNTPVYVPLAPTPWPKRADGKPRRAGVNAFGIGGLNMHVAIDEYTESGRALAARYPGAPKQQLSPDEQAIAVIGLGCVLPGAANPGEFWQMLASQRDPKQVVPGDRFRADLAFDANDPKAPRAESLVGGFITDFVYDWKRHKVPPKQVAQADPLQFMLLEATDQAMQDAGYDKKSFNRENVGVVVGTEFGGDFSFQLQIGLRIPELEEHIEQLLTSRGWQPQAATQLAKDYSEALLARWPALIDETGSFSTSSLASRIGKTWNLMGGAAAIDAGETSGLASLSTSIDLLLAHDSDMMICAAGQRRMGWPQYESLAHNDMLAAGSPRSPLDANNNGQVPGEGVVVLLLKRLADAQRDGDKVHAILRGVGAAHDTLSWGKAFSTAIERSFAECTAKPADVAVLELDALGGKATTAEEVNAVAQVYGKDHRNQPLLLSSVLGHVGNTQGASSLVSMLKAVLEVSHGEVPASLGMGAPTAEIASQSGVLSAPSARTAISLTTPDGRRLAAVGSCSRGLAYHAVLEYGSKVQVAAQPAAPAQQPAIQTTAAASAAPVPPNTPNASLNMQELEKFLINFVVEQTGYPPEVVELDADLEADLGIDSIKKAQMFGELQEYFDVTTSDNLTLDDFPTLRHIVNFLASVPQKGPAPPAPAPVAVAPVQAAPVTVTPAAAAAPASSTKWEVCRFGAADLAGLKQLVAAAANDATAWDASRSRKFTAVQTARLAVVADSAATLTTRLALADKQLDNPAAQTVLEQQGVFYRQARPNTRVVFLFPGQGSQYTGMLRQLVADVPAAAAEQAKIDAAMSRLGFPTWPQLAWDAASPLGKDVFTTQISMLLGDLIVLAALRDRGITPDVVAGHSYGEYAALVAAGAWDLEQAARVTRRRCDSIEAIPAGQGGMLATTAPAEMIDQFSARVSGPVYAANYNAPDQTVVGGSLPALAELKPLLEAAGFEARMLSVPCPFHTPLMRDAGELFRGHLANETFQPTRVPLYSVATNEMVRDPREMAPNLVAHLSTPVRYAELIRKLANGAPSVFVEVGPQQALTKLNRRIIPGEDFAGIATDNSSRPGVEQLVRVQALLEVTGALEREETQTPVAPKSAEPRKQGQVWHFDATERRRERMKQSSSGVAPTGPSRLPPRMAPTAPLPTSTNGTSTHESNGNGHAGKQVEAKVAVAVAPAPPPAKPSTPPAPAPAAVAAQTEPARTNLNLAELEKFLVNFVVEQTGYPAEVVELDADLEADLGIDSIKKAQMFGELQEYFDVTTSDNLTLDDFPTLRHIVNFLAKVPQKGATPVAAPAAVAAPAPAPAAAQSAVKTAPAPIAAAPTPQAANAPNIAELEKFLVNFVVEQTGYPAEVIGLDADLEADLGIDSIKKAQMFGELQEYFDVTTTDNLTLDDFPTLRHIVNFLAQAPQKGAAPVAAPAPVAASSGATAISPAPLPAPAISTGETPVAPQTNAPNIAELEKFLINFVVEQTGYPAEVIELDADLEADLGIDSIKKAQMFGELQEYFDVTPTDNLTLDDFPTLRHIVNFLAQAPQKGAAPAAIAPAANVEVAAQTPAPVSAPNIDMSQVRGTPTEMGYQQGAEKKTELRAILRRLADLTDHQWAELPIPPGARANPQAYFSPSQWEELRGMAEAAGVVPGNLAALNLAVQGDLASSSAQVVVRAANGSLLHALVYESSLPAGLVELLKPQVLIREPAQGFASATVTLSGIVGSSIGANGQGLVASSGMLVNAASQPNTALVHSVDMLLQTSANLSQAAELLPVASNASAWNATLSRAAEGRMIAAEQAGAGISSQAETTSLVQANHCLLTQGAQPADVESQQRLATIQQLVSSPNCPRDAQGLLAALVAPAFKGTLRLAVVVDAANGDLWIDNGSLHERVHVGPMLSAAPAGDVAALVGELTAQKKTAEIKPVVVPPSDDLVENTDPENGRFVLRLLPSPWPTLPPEFPVWKGAAAIHGDNALADAFEKQLTGCGVKVVRLKESSDIDRAVAELDAHTAESPIMHLFLCNHRNAAPLDRTSADAWETIYRERVLLPYFLTQRMLTKAGDAKRLDDCTVVAATDLGGDLGFSGAVESPESGFLTGFMKSLLLEYNIMRGHKTFYSKAVDSPRSESPELLAANICRELATGTNDYELAFVNGDRYLQVALPVATPLETESNIRSGGNWVLTGGARGITAECGLEFGRRFGLKLNFIGSSPLVPIDPAWRSLDEKGLAELRAKVIIEARAAGQKPNEAWDQVAKRLEIDRNLRAFADAGVQVTYHACDVTNRAALARVLDAIRAADGPIDGILHGAGIEQASRFEKKTAKTVLATVGSKAMGAYYLMDLTRQDPVKHFFGFGSISGRLGSNGQTDYAAASDMLLKLMSWYRRQRPECHAVGFHWHPWDEVGMASRPETEATLKHSNIRLMPKQTGIRHLLRELYTHSRESELLVTDWEYHQRYYPKHLDEIAVHAGLLGAPGQPLPAPSQVEPADAKHRVADRVILRMADAPLAANEPTQPLPSAAFILGSNADAQALASRLTSQGVKVVLLPQVNDVSQATSALEAAWRETPAECLILATGRDPLNCDLLSQSAAAQRAEQGVYIPFWVTRRWFQLLGERQEQRQATVVALTSLSGSFGFTGDVPNPEGGALAGLLKSIFVEDARFDHARFRVKVLDAPTNEPSNQLAEAVCHELASHRPEIEVAWSAGRRQVATCVRRPVESLPLADLPRGGNWVVTGGGRGITAATALELGRRYGAKMHLLGKSPAPEVNPPWRNCSDEELKAIKTAIVRKATLEGRSPTDDWDRVRKDREIQETLDKFAAAGVTATYHACDVADWNDVERVLNEIRAAHGPIEGVIHGAGYAKSFRFGTGAGDRIRQTIVPKVDGTLALMHHTRKDPLKYFAAFGSLSGRFGGNGLSDYAAANDMLAKLCGWFRRVRPECHTTCLHWQTWDQIGMAMLADGVGITKNAFKMDFIPPAEGVNHFIDELRAGAPEAEVLITDGFFQRALYPYDLDQPAAVETYSQSRPQASATSTTVAPLVAEHTQSSPGTSQARIVFDPRRDPFLTDHLLKQKPFLPGVIGVESLLEAAQLDRPAEPIHEIQNVRIINGMAFPQDAPISARVTVTEQGDALACVLSTELRDRQGRLIDPARVHVEGSVPAQANAIQAEAPGNPPLGWMPYAYPDQGLLYHGTPLRCLKAVAYQYDGGWGQIVAPPLAELAGARAAEGWLLPTAVLDACVVACGSFLFLQFGGVLEVPYGFEALRWSRLPHAGEKCVIRLFFRERGDRHSRFDFVLFGENGEAVLEAVGYQTIRVGAGGR